MHLYDTADGWVLTNMSRLQRGAGIAVMLLVGQPLVYLAGAIVGALVWDYMLGLGPPHLLNLVALILIALVLPAIPALMLLAVFRVLGIHRRSTVRVDLSRQMCDCRNKLMGVTTQRICLDLTEASWVIRGGTLLDEPQKSASAAGGVTILLLVIMGPLALLLWLLESRRDRDAREADAVQLVLHLGDTPCAVMTLTQEEVAEQFLLRWDKQTGLGNRR